MKHEDIYWKRAPIVRKDARVFNYWREVFRSGLLNPHTQGSASRLFDRIASAVNFWYLRRSVRGRVRK